MGVYRLEFGDCVGYQAVVRSGGPENTKFYASGKYGGDDQAEYLALRAEAELKKGRKRYELAGLSEGIARERQLRNVGLGLNGVSIQWMTMGNMKYLMLRFQFYDAQNVKRCIARSLHRFTLRQALREVLPTRTAAGFPRVTLERALQIMMPIYEQKIMED